MWGDSTSNQCWLQAHWMIEGEPGATRILNLHPSTLRSRMQKLGIKRPRLQLLAAQS